MKGFGLVLATIAGVGIGHVTASEADELMASDTDVSNSIFKQIATNCRLPEQYVGIKQSWSKSVHRTTQTGRLMAIKHVNVANQAGVHPEILRFQSFTTTNGGTISIADTTMRCTTVVEMPLNSGQFYMATMKGSRIGHVAMGTEGVTDFIQFKNKFKKGTKFAVYTWRHINSTSIGLPMCKGMPVDDLNSGTLKVDGGDATIMDMFMRSTPAQIAAVINTYVNGSDQYVPAAIIALPTKDYDHNAIFIMGDSRHVGTILPDKDDLLAGVAERVWCKNGRAYINASVSGDNSRRRFDNGYASVAMSLARHCDVFGNALGTNDAAYYALAETVVAEEKRILNFPVIARMKREALTIPPNTYGTTQPTDRYTTLEGQNLSPTSQPGVLNLNEYRRSNPDRLYSRVYDVARIVTDMDTGKWKVGAKAGSAIFDVVTGSPIVTFKSGVTFTADYNNIFASLPVNTANAMVNVALVRIDDTHARMMTVDPLRRPTAEYLAKVDVTDGTCYLDVYAYTNDGLHDSISAAIKQYDHADDFIIEEWPDAA